MLLLTGPTTEALAATRRLSSRSSATAFPGLSIPDPVRSALRTPPRQSRMREPRRQPCTVCRIRIESLNAVRALRTRNASGSVARRVGCRITFANHRYGAEPALGLICFYAACFVARLLFFPARMTDLALVPRSGRSRSLQSGQVLPLLHVPTSGSVVLARHTRIALCALQAFLPNVPIAEPPQSAVQGRWRSPATLSIRRK